MIAMLTEVLHVNEETMVFPHAESMSLDFLGDGCWILTEVLGNVLEGSSFVDCFFNVQSAIIVLLYERVNATCARLTSTSGINGGI